MNRRDLIALIACIPALATPAGACSVALTNPRETGLQNGAVRHLFEAWWDHDDESFRSILSGIPAAGASRTDVATARALLESEPVPRESLAIYGRYFTRPNMVRRLHFMVNTAAGVVVGCSEAREDGVMESDCSGMPEFHLFLVSMLSDRPMLISHIATEASVDAGKASIWMEG